MNRSDIVGKYLDSLISDPKCELNYNSDYQLLIAVMLSAQTTDKRVNQVTEVLFREFDGLEALKEAPISRLEEILRPIGSFRKKTLYVKEISTLLVDKYNFIMPKERPILETLPGVGRKTVSVLLSELYDYPEFAVDTHVDRVSKRLGLAKDNDNVIEIELKLKRKFKKTEWSRRHKQLVLFGRYYCKAIKPDCDSCGLRDICKKKY